MAIPGQANINIANTPNDPVGSDSLFTAFKTVQNNFTQLFTQASPIVAVSSGAGINVTSPTANSVQITNTGVTSLIAGNNITISSPTGAGATTGSLIIDATGLSSVSASSLTGNVNNNIAVTATANTTATVGNVVTLVINGVTYQLLAV